MLKKILILTIIILFLTIGCVSASDSSVVLDANDTVKVFNYKESFEVDVSYNNGTPVNSGNLTFSNLFGKDYTVNVLDGKAVLSNILMERTGLFKIDISYSGECDVSSSFNLYVPVLDITLEEPAYLATRYGNTVYLSGALFETFTGEEEEVIEGVVTFYTDNGEIGKSLVDYNGNFICIWNATEDILNKEITVYASYFDKAGNYNNYSFTKTFSFPQNLNTHIIYDVNSYDDYVLITGKVLDENENPVCGGDIEVNFNNQIYTVPVDTYGNFKLYITDKESEVSYEVSYFDWGSRADITQNIPLMNFITHTELTDKIIELCNYGTPYVKFGNGNGPSIILNAGLHGGELANQAAALRLINLLADFSQEIDGTIYVVPFLFPEATANNTRMYNGINLNTVANKNGSLSNNLAMFALSVDAIALGDFHNTRHSNSDAKGTCIFCSLSPTYESFEIAEFINSKTGYYMDVYKVASISALEDYCNTIGIPSVTCEALTNHGNIEYGAPEVSYNEMLNFLMFYGFDIENIFKIQAPLSSGSYDLEITYLASYNYNSSNCTLKDVFVKENSNETSNNSSNSNLPILMENTGNMVFLLVLGIFLICCVSIKRNY